MHVVAGPLGIAPVYVACKGDELHGSWDVADLSEFASSERMVDRVVARLLSRRHRYSTDTLFSEIHRITEPTVATFTEAGINLRYPPDALHVLKARHLASDADPVSEFRHRLNKIVQPIFDANAQGVGVELSGGLDSANVALSMASCGESQICSFGVLIDGVDGKAQVLRRMNLADKLEFRDYAVPVRDHLPFDLDGSRLHVAHDGDGEVYWEAFDAMRRKAVSHGVHTILTGFGGDEMLALRLAERDAPPPLPALPGWLGPRVRRGLNELETNVAPSSAVAVPTLMAAARHPNYLRAGLWPVAPLAQPDMLQLGESLPVPLRNNKDLFRQRLARAGFGPAVTHPERPESFGPSMALALARHAPRLVAGMLKESILVDLGYVNPYGLAEVLDLADRGQPLPPLLYDTLAVELGLRSMTVSERTGTKL
ncbi:asparagine synthase (glutamine-hydrolyzing) [Pseudonocardia eucalypti]|uniref:asparagine synthase-related protein n=1 Tax=Pseudonocardia eucalypti TaxID=648755 RepID=UPI00161FCABD|nr:asparagine synthase (glutamine-hydrolyzing) [Pseudonocardia eucalypti]